MDFDRAAQRLARDQSKLKQKKKGFGGAISQQAQRQVQERQKQQAARQAKRLQEQQALKFRQDYMRQCEQRLQQQQLSRTGQPLALQATSIHGDGDKVALPPSVLEYLTSDGDTVNNRGGNPWIFRLAICNPNYAGFPQSPLIQQMQPPDDDSMEMDYDDDDDDDDNETKELQAYLEEMSHQYLAWTYGTVVEFTQEEGCVGLPAALASSLISQGNHTTNNPNAAIPVTRTVDPALGSKSQPSLKDEDINEGESNQPMLDDENTGEEKTPGHLAYGEFDLPNLPLEVSLVQLPKGRSCVLKPTPEAIQRGFYQLKDVKLVLEQSLIRTRAVLSVGDCVHTWHRGVSYDLHVDQVEPAAYRAIVCINTDLTVDFAAVEENKPLQASAVSTKEAKDVGYTLSKGRTLQSLSTEQAKPNPPPPQALDVGLPPEPSSDSECAGTVQIRGLSGGSVQRRLNLSTATVSQLFALGQTLLNASETNDQFQLVTRFPRRVLTLDAESGNQKLTDVTSLIPGGQEMFIMERP